MELPKLAIAALGGTVSMQSTQDGQGVVPAVSGEALLNTVPELNVLARATVETFGLLPSASLDFEYLLNVLDWANAQISRGVAAVIIIQGTDTLEESATFFDYLWAHDEPLVLTGAMRSAMQAGADGPANLLDAGRVALAACSRGRGAQVVINGEIHRANSVRKVDSMAMHAFASPLTGPAGLLVESAPRYFQPPVARHVLPMPQDTLPKIALLEASLGADSMLLDKIVESGYDGLVIAGFGAGHVSAHWAEVIEGIARHIPVIIATRTGCGATAQATYGFAGSEIDLTRKGAVMAGFLCPRKARILLWLLVACRQQAQLVKCLAESTP
ncbi:asparaginase [Pseudomonas triticicola]|uniref:Asparaginase n=1 Tax=Pseudomonas triticicola TaxID=2842345 RepID=A0ABS6RV97_9PSED|nr:asparaginase [Pseudomonas triticicola]MBV4549280.1 asparaginase [Pseudomonas triticicola]